MDILNEMTEITNDFFKQADNFIEKTKESEKAKLITELNDLKDRMFMLKMEDHWDSSDYRYSDELHSQITAIRNELKNKYGYEEE